MHCALWASAVAPPFLKTTSGLGCALPPLGPFWWPSLAPWQLVQLGVRLSATVPCLVLPMSRTPGAPPSSWHFVHWASPLRKRAAFGSAAQTAEAPPSQPITVKTASVL